MEGLSVVAGFCTREDYHFSKISIDAGPCKTQADSHVLRGIQGVGAAAMISASVSSLLGLSIRAISKEEQPCQFGVWMIVVINRCLDSKGLFTLRNFADVEAAWERRASFMSEFASGSSRAATQ